MEDIFFDATYSNLQQLLGRIIIFLILSGLLLYIIFFVFSKLLFRKSSHPKEIALRLSFLWSLFAYFIVFNIYIFVFILKTGLDSMHWTNLKFYLGLIAQFIVFFGTICFFFIKRHSLTKIINEKSII